MSNLYADDLQVFHILYLNSYQQGFAWSDSISEGLTSGLADSGLNTEISYEYMDTKRFARETVFPAFRALLSGKYPRDMFQAVVVSDDNAFDFALSNRNHLFPDVPLVFCGVNNAESPYILNRQNLTGVLEDIDLKGLLRLIVEMHPEVTYIAGISDATESGALHIEAAAKEITAEYPGIAFVPFQYWTLDELSKGINELPDTTVAIEFAFHRDKTGTILTLEDEERFLHQKIAIPVYTLWDYKLGYGILGGVMTSGKVHGEVAAGMVIRILEGISPDAIPVESHIPYPVIFDFNEMKRFSIKPDELPEGAEIINLPRSLWHQYRLFIVLILVFIVFQAVVIIILVINISRRITAEKKLRELNADLEERVANRTRELKNSLDNLMITQDQLIESEKLAALGGLVAGIAHEINTPLGVSITAASHMQSILQESVESSKLFDQMREAVGLLMKNLNSTAGLIDKFRQIAVPQSLEKPLPVNLRDCIETVVLGLKPYLDSAKVLVNIDCPSDTVLISFSAALYKVFTNLIQNSVFHGFEKNDSGYAFIIGIQVTSDGNNVRIHYSDNGSGIPEEIRNRVFEPFFYNKVRPGRKRIGAAYCVQ